LSDQRSTTPSERRSQAQIAFAEWWANNANSFRRDAPRLPAVAAWAAFSAAWHAATPSSESTESPCDFKLAAQFFAEEMFALLPHRRVHSLSREVWHEAEETDATGLRCVAFLQAEFDALESHPDHPMWFRFRDPAKRAMPSEKILERL
jgi:hypothetical protein